MNPHRSCAERAGPEAPFVMMVAESLEGAARERMAGRGRSFDDGDGVIVTTRPGVSTPGWPEGW